MCYKPALITSRTIDPTVSRLVRKRLSRNSRIPNSGSMKREIGDAIRENWQYEEPS